MVSWCILMSFVLHYLFKAVGIVKSLGGWRKCFFPWQKVDLLIASEEREIVSSSSKDRHAYC